MGGAQLAADAGALGTTKPLLPGTPPPWVQLPKRATPPEVGARLGIPVLRQGSIKEMFLEMQGWMRVNRNASQAQLADFFEGMARQISNAHPSWQANRTVLSDGTIAFIGRNAENIFAIRPNGQMLQSNPAVGALRINPQTGKYELNYSVMREID